MALSVQQYLAKHNIIGLLGNLHNLQISPETVLISEVQNRLQRRPFQSAEVIEKNATNDL